MRPAVNRCNPRYKIATEDEEDYTLRWRPLTEDLTLSSDEKIYDEFFRFHTALDLAGTLKYFHWFLIHPIKIKYIVIIGYGFLRNPPLPMAFTQGSTIIRSDPLNCAIMYKRTAQFGTLEPIRGLPYPLPEHYPWL